MKYLLVAVVCMLMGSLAVSAQGMNGIAGLAQLDKAAEAAASQIKPTLQGLLAGTRIKIADFYLNDAETDLERYWRVQLAGLLAENAKYTILCTEAESDVASDYVLRGNMLQTNDELRIYTRLIRVEGSAIVKSWTTDLARSDFLDGMTQIAGASGVRRDRYETDSRTNPVAVTLGGGDIARTFHDNHDDDWFSITPEAASILVVETTGSLDTYMRLYDGSSINGMDENEMSIAANDDSGSGSNAKIEQSVKAGTTYIVHVKDLDRGTGGYGFSARLEPLPVDSAEPNDSRENAALLKADERFNGVFGKENDIDWYKIEIPSGGRLLSIASNGESIEEKIEVYAGDELLGEKSDCDCGGTVQLTVKVPAGTVFIKMTEQSGEIGSYALTATVRQIPPPDTFEDDDRKALAKPIELGIAQAHTFSDSDDVDWVKFTVSERGNYEIAVSGTRGSLDSYMELFDESENLIDEDDDSGGSYDSRIRSRLDAGTYYVKIRCMDNGPLEDNRYTVRVSASER